MFSPFFVIMGQQVKVKNSGDSQLCLVEWLQPGVRNITESPLAEPRLTLAGLQFPSCSSIRTTAPASLIQLAKTQRTVKALSYSFLRKTAFS